MSSIPYTREEIQTFMNLRKQGKTNGEISKVVNRPTSSLNTLSWAIKVYEETGERVKSISNNTFALLRELSGTNGIAHTQQETTVIAQPSQASVEGNLKRLEDAFMTFQKELVSVIETEATRRSEEKVAEKEAALAEMKKRYEKEMSKMQDILTQAKESNVAGFLRKSWMGK